MSSVVGGRSVSWSAEAPAATATANPTADCLAFIVRGDFVPMRM
jgi:hypothetical protein